MLIALLASAAVIASLTGTSIETAAQSAQQTSKPKQQNAPAKEVKKAPAPPPKAQPSARVPTPSGNPTPRDPSRDVGRANTSTVPAPSGSAQPNELRRPSPSSSVPTPKGSAQPAPRPSGSREPAVGSNTQPLNTAPVPTPPGLAQPAPAPARPPSGSPFGPDGVCRTCVSPVAVPAPSGLPTPLPASAPAASGSPTPAPSVRPPAGGAPDNAIAFTSPVPAPSGSPTPLPTSAPTPAPFGSATPAPLVRPPSGASAPPAPPTASERPLASRPVPVPSGGPTPAGPVGSALTPASGSTGLPPGSSAPVPGPGGAPQTLVSPSTPGSQPAVLARPGLATAATAGAVGAGFIWIHNSSTMRLLDEQGRVRFVYEVPRAGLGNLGIQPGTVLFDGRKTGVITYSGDAMTFSPKQCGEAKFPVAGESTQDGSRVILRGQRPVRDARCQITGYQPDNLEFVLQRQGR